MRIVLLIPVLVLSGCLAASELTGGTAIWPFVLSNDTSVEDLAHVRGGVAVVAVFYVDELYGLDELPVSGAVGHVTVDGSEVALVEQVAGLYSIELSDFPTLYAAPDSPAEATIVVEGVPHVAAATTGTPLAVTIETELHEAGRKLVVDLPNGYEEDYDQVLVEVRDLDGVTTWSNVPDSFRGWLDFAASRWTPEEIEIPGSAFPSPDRLYAVSVFGAIRSREDASFSESLTSKLSGFTTGSALAIPVYTAP